MFFYCERCCTIDIKLPVGIVICHRLACRGQPFLGKVYNQIPLRKYSRISGQPQLYGQLTSSPIGAHWVMDHL